MKSIENLKVISVPLVKGEEQIVPHFQLKPVQVEDKPFQYLYKLLMEGKSKITVQQDDLLITLFTCRTMGRSILLNIKFIGLHIVAKAAQIFKIPSLSTGSEIDWEMCPVRPYFWELLRSQKEVIYVTLYSTET